MTNGSMHDAGSVAAIVLASGMSRRFGSENKLLASLGGVTVLRRTLEAYVGSDVAPILLVVGHQHEEVAGEVRDLPIRVVRNSHYALGQSTSVVHGVGALPATVDAVIIGVGDQPLLSPAIIAAILHMYRARRAPMVVPRYDGRRGNPVLFDRSLFHELRRLRGDAGGRQVLDRHQDLISWVDFSTERAGTDVDTPADLSRVQKQFIDDRES